MGETAGPEVSSTASNSKSVDFESMYEAVKNKHLRVDGVYLEGLNRTKYTAIGPALEKLQAVHSLEELRQVLLDSWEYLDALDIFNAVELTVIEGRPERPDTCNVQLRVVEKGIFSAHAGTYAQGKDCSVDVAVGATNPLGFGEHLLASAGFGINKSNEFAIIARKNRLRGLDVDGEFRVLQHTRNQQWTSSFIELLRGGSLGLKSADGRHAFDYLLHWRHISDPLRKASREVIQQCGHKLKSSLQYTFTCGTMTQAVPDTPGYDFRAVSEVAGLGPASSLRFLKQHVGFQWGTPLTPRSALVFGVAGGVLMPWGPKSWSTPTCISDRFFLGGPASLWGFHLHGLGPSDERRERSGSEEGGVEGRRDALGGDLMTTITAALRFQPPIHALQDIGLYGHAFVQGGNSVLLSGTSTPLRETIHNFMGSFRWTMGIGIVWPTTVGNLEVNFCQVYKHQPFDRVRNGIEIGVTARSLW